MYLEGCRPWKVTAECAKRAQGLLAVSGGACLSTYTRSLVMAASPSFYEFSAKDIDGNEVSMEKYKDRVCIVVNVASK